MWYEETGRENDVILASRVRLARNVEGYAFPDTLSKEGAELLIRQIEAVFAGRDGWEAIDMASLSGAARAALLEKHTISREFAEKKGPTALLSSDAVSIMVMEEDHLRIQAITAGLDLERAAKAVFATEEMLDEALTLAFDERLGYITHCPTNLGTGMRASVMMHLPAYTKAGGIRTLSMQLSKLGMTIRGMNGEGSAPSGQIYQISNEVTLGLSEEETIARLNEIVGQIAAKERELRGKIGDAERDALINRVMRSIGVLKYATAINAGELLSIYTELRMAAGMGLVSVPCALCDRILFTTMPNTLLSEDESAKTAAGRDRLRAARIQAMLDGITITHA